MRVNSVKNDTQSFGNGKDTKLLMRDIRRRARQILNMKRNAKANSNRDRVLEKMYNQEMEDIDRFCKNAESMTLKTSK